MSSSNRLGLEQRFWARVVNHRRWSPSFRVNDTRIRELTKSRGGGGGRSIGADAVKIKTRKLSDDMWHGTWNLSMMEA